MVNKRFLDIIRLLLKHDDYITINEISNILNVSNKTIRNDLVQVGEWLTEYDLQLIKKTGVGIAIHGSNAQKLKIYHLIKEKNSQNIDYSPQARKIYIGMKLLLNDKCHIYELAEELYVSRATIHKDILSLTPLFESSKIKINRKNNNGLFIEGSEKNIRNLLFEFMIHDNGYSVFSQMIKNTNFTCDGSFPFAALDVNDDELKEFLKVLESVNNKSLHNLLFTVLIQIILHFLISFVRISQNKSIVLSENFISELKSQPFYDDICELVNALENHYHIYFPDNEKRYLQIFLISVQNSEDLELKNKKDAADLTIQLLTEWDKSLPGYNFLKDQELYNMVYRHLCPSITRFKYDIMIENPLMNDIESLYSNTFKIIKNSIHIIEEKYNCTVSNDEIGFLTLHLATALNREKKPLNTLLVSHGNIGATNLLAQKLTTQFPEINIIKIHNFVNIHDANLLNIDLILSTIDLTLDYDIPIITINLFLYDYDISRLKNIINTYYKKKNDPINLSKKADI